MSCHSLVARPSWCAPALAGAIAPGRNRGADNAKPTTRNDGKGVERRGGEHRGMRPFYYISPLPPLAPRTRARTHAHDFVQLSSLPPWLPPCGITQNTAERQKKIRAEREGGGRNYGVRACVDGFWRQSGSGPARTSGFPFESKDAREEEGLGRCLHTHTQAHAHAPRRR